MTLRRLNDSLARVLDERRRIDAEIRPARVEARNDDGTLQMRPLHGEFRAVHVKAVTRGAEHGAAHQAHRAGQ